MVESLYNSEIEKKGYEKGIQKSQKEFIKNVVELGSDDEFILKVLKISKKELDDIKKELKLN